MRCISHRRRRRRRRRPRSFRLACECMKQMSLGILTTSTYNAPPACGQEGLKWSVEWRTPITVEMLAMLYISCILFFEASLFAALYPAVVRSPPTCH